MLQERARSTSRIFGKNLNNNFTQEQLPIPSRKNTHAQPPPTNPLSLIKPLPTPHQYLQKRDVCKNLATLITEKNRISVPARKIVVEWLIDVHLRFKLLHETLFIAVIMMDKVLASAEDIRLGELQLLGTTVLWMASKYEEIYPPQLKYFAEVTDGAFAKKDILRMQEIVLRALNFNLTFPTRSQFLLREIQSHSHLSNEIRIKNLCLFLLQLSLLRPWSEKEEDLAKASIFLASQMLKQTRFLSALECDKLPNNIKRVAFNLIGYLSKNSVSAKYDSEMYGFVGGLTLEF